MTAWRHGLARSAWAAFLVLFAVRAIAGAALCELYGEHSVPPGAQHVAEAHAHAAYAHGARGSPTHENHSPSEQPSHDRDDHVCEEPVYLNGERASLSTVKGSLTVHAIPSSLAPARDWAPVVVAMSVAPTQLAHPPPSCTRLDVSSRLHSRLRIRRTRACGECARSCDRARRICLRTRRDTAPAGALAVQGRARHERRAPASGNRHFPTLAPRTSQRLTCALHLGCTFSLAVRRKWRRTPEGKSERRGGESPNEQLPEPAGPLKEGCRLGQPDNR